MSSQKMDVEIMLAGLREVCPSTPQRERVVPRQLVACLASLRSSAPSVIPIHHTAALSFPTPEQYTLCVVREKKTQIDNFLKENGH